MSPTVLLTLLLCAYFWCSTTAGPGDFGLITAGDSLYNISMDTQVIEKFPISGLMFPAGVDYDPMGRKIYWTEYLGNKIGRCDLNGANQELNFITKTIQPYGLVIDASNRWLYWSAEVTTGNSVIERAQLDGSQQSVIANIGTSLPRHIALDTSQNKLYWTDQRNHGIRRMSADGSGLVETVVATATNTKIHGITLDIEAGLLFWCDWGKDTIEMYNLATSQTSVIYQSAVEINPYGLALYKQDIYWVDNTLPILQTIPRAGLNQGQIPENFGTYSVPFSEFSEANGLKIVTSVCSNVVCRNGGTCVTEPSGDDVFTCLCTASYLGRLCETLKSECDTPEVPTNVFVSADALSVGTTATFVCQTGYELIGASKATCRPDLTWSNESPTCVRTCPSITPPTNGAISPSVGPYLADHPLTFSCNQGFYLVGLVTILCDAQGQWDSTNYPSCSTVVQTCPAVRQLQNGYISGSFEIGATITFICNSGFALSGSAQITCGADLQWSTGPPSCVPVCDTPPVHPNVFISTSFFPVMTILMFTCPEGFTIIGASQATCRPDFTWSVESPTCARTCPVVTPPLNGAMSPTTTSYHSGEQITFSCNSGYRLVGLVTISCTETGAWSSTNYPTCTEIVVTCSQPAVPQNGNVFPVQPSYNADQMVTFQCANGYQLSGQSSSATCLGDGTWSIPTPTCQTVNCVQPTVPFQGSLQPVQSIYTVGQTVTFLCNAGYQITVGHQPFAECSAGGTWSAPTPTCTEITCLRPAHPTSGTLSPTLTTYAYGQHVTFNCNDGFQLVGEETLTCIAEITWSNSSPECEAISCIPPAQPGNGNISPVLSSYTFQQQVTFTCGDSYQLVGDATITCTASNTWSAAVPLCQEITCAAPAQPQNGGVGNLLSSYAHGQAVSFSCDDGYHLVGEVTSTCTGPNIWSPPVPSCEDIRCNAPAQPQNGNITPTLTSYVHQQEVTYTCGTGYYIIGVQTIRCTGLNMWSSTFPTCQAITCSPPTSLQNGYINPSLLSYTFNQEIVFRCNDGYQAIGSSSAQCTLPNVWTNPAPTCQELASCEAPVRPINGNIIPAALSSYQVGDRVTFQCDTNHRLTGDESVTCLESGGWTNTSPTCQVITCLPLTQPANGQISPDLGSYSIDQQVSITCNNNYQLVGTSVLFCLFDGTWSNAVPICQEILCTAPSDPVNGFVSPVRGRNPIGTVLSFTCQSGYQLSGVSSISCTGSGTWSSPFPRCVQTPPTSCTVPPLLTNGNIAPPESSYPIGISISYTCNTGYNLKGSSPLRCTSDGSWSANFPTCVQQITCLPPTTPADGAIQPTSGPYNQDDQVTFSCSAGFQLRGVSAVICQADGTWTENSPTCSQEYCQQPVVPTNGGVIPTGQIASGSSVIFQCDSGFRIEGTREVICTSQLQWSNPSPMCLVVTCTPPSLANGNFQPIRATYALTDQVTFTCSTGFELIGETSSTCNLQEDNAALWSPTTPICVKEGTRCPSLDPPPFGQILPAEMTSYPVGERVTFQCNDGYDLLGNAETICTSDSTWSEAVPSCEREVCNRPRTLYNGQITPTQGPFTIGYKVTFKCNTRFALIGSQSSVCTNQRTWSEETPICERKAPSCPVPNTTSNMILRPEQGPYDVGIVIRFSCENGFNIDGEETAICTNNLKWSEEFPTCAASPTDRSRNEPVLKPEDLNLILYTAIPSVAFILLIIMCCCCYCCCRKRRRGRGDTTGNLIMSYRKENTTFPSGQGTDIYNIYGGRDNRPLAPMRQSRHLNNTGNHQNGDNYAENSLGTLESHRSLPTSNSGSHHSSSLPAAESTGHYANLEETLDRTGSKRRRQQQQQQPMNQLTRV